MRRSARLLALATGSLLVTCLVPAGPASAAPTPTPAPSAPNPAPAAPGTSAAPASPDVIVLLRDQHRSIPNTPARQALRKRTLRADQKPVVARADRLGARNIHQFSSVNAVALTLDVTKQKALAADPAVRAVVPDLQIRLPQRSQQQITAAAAAATPARLGRTCPASPAQPIHEPEALQTMSVESTTGTGGAHAITRGAGVKVGYIADGLDPNNPDFIRNGKSVFVDYQDFTNDGPQAPTSGAEAFGDASAIAAQGNQTYDLAAFVNEAQPLPKGCTIKVVGVAPDADLVGLKVFGQDTAPTSRFVQAIEYAVNVAHVDVLNESFGQNPYADTADDPVSLVNSAAVQAGTTVVTSTGDAGITGTISSPASAKDVIAVGATDIFRGYAQTNYGYVNLPGVKAYANENISGLSSAGFAQNGKVPDVVAPGDSGWALCSTDVKLYTDCGNFTDDATGSGVQLFGGTSQSSPLAAGAAALVIAAYRTGHPGASDPSPALVKRLLTSTARDLDHPAELQGAGEVNARVAVKEALSVPTEGTTKTPASARGASLLVDQPQLDLSGKSGATPGASLSVTNLSSKTRTISAQVRSLTASKGSGKGTITFDPAKLPRVVNAFGGSRAYAATSIKVGKGVDRIDFSAAFVAGAQAVFAVLVDPKGTYQAYSVPQGASNYAHLDARNPIAGTWKAYVLADPAFSGKVAYSYQLRSYAARGSATVATKTLKPGQSTAVALQIPLPKDPSDESASVQITGVADDTSRTSVPVSLRSTVEPSAGTAATFRGTITGGNGRDASPAQTNSYYVDVPDGAPNLSVAVKLTGQTTAGEPIKGILVSPQGQPLSAVSNSELTSRNRTVAAARLQLFVRKPAAGRWQLVLWVDNPVAGTLAAQPFTGAVSLTGITVSATPKLPTTAATVLKAGRTAEVKVKVTNTGVASRLFFADPRLSRTGIYTLASQTPGDDQQAENLLDFPLAAWLVPTRTRSLTISATSNHPLGLDAGWDYLNPEIYGRASPDGATVSLATARIAPGPWYAQAGPVGTFTSKTGTPGTVAYTAKVRAQLFDPAVSTSTGDFWQSSLIPVEGDADLQAAVAGRPVAAKPSLDWSGSKLTAQAAALAATTTGPLVLGPGKSGTIVVQITPRTADKGKVIKGSLDIDTMDLDLSTGDEVAKFSYLYTVG